MKQVVIENPVINSPFREPARHFRFTDEGITDEIIERRRVSSYFIPIAQPRKKGKQLGFAIPYTIGGEHHNYLPDFIVRLHDGRGKDDPLNLILEVTGQRDKDKQAKADTARNLWVPAINNHGRFGRWAFIEIADPWDAKDCIRAAAESRP